MAQPSTFLIDSAVPTFQDLAFSSPIFWTSNRTYTFGKQSGTGGANKALFYLSLDGGATWTEPDSADASIANGLAVYWWDGSTKVCNIAFLASNSGSQGLKLQDFDLDAETYSATYGATSPPTGVFTALGSVNRMANGSLMVFYHKIVSGITSRAYVAVFSGGLAGTWTTVDLDLDVALNPGGFTVWDGAIPDPTNNLCHVFFTDTLGNFFYRQIASDGTLGGITAFPAGFNIATPNLNFGRAFNTGYLRNGNLYVPVFTKVAGIFSLNEIVGTPASAPVFSISAAIDTAVNGNTGSDPGQAIGLHIGTTDYVLYFIGDGTNEYNLVKLATNSGSGWSIQTLYDATVDPNAQINPHNNQWLNTISGTVDPSSGFQFQVANWHTYSGQANLTVLSTQFSGSSSLALACGNPPSGQISQAYSSALAPSGGTPPYTFAVTSASLKQTNNAFQGAPGLTGQVNLLATAAGSLIAVTLIGGGFRTVTGVTDNSGNVYTQAAGSRATSGEWWSEVWYCLNALAGVTSITATLTAAAGNEFRELVAYEVNAAGITFGSGVGFAGTSQGTAATAATITIAQKSFIAACLLDIASSVLSVNGPFSGGATNSSDGMASLVTPTPGPYAPVFNFDAPSGFVSSIAAFGSASLNTGLPPGLTLDPATGIISGTPTVLGLYTFTVQVTDSLAATASVTCSISILPLLPPVTFGVGGMGCLPECVDPCKPMSAELLDRFSRVLARGALILAGGRRRVR